MECGAQLSIHTSLLNRVVWSARFVDGGVLPINLAYRRSVAVVFMIFKIESNPMYPLSGALPLPYEPVHATPGALASHRLRVLDTDFLRTAGPLCPQ